MQRRFAWAGGLVLGVGLFLAVSPARALITKLTSLGEMLKDSQYIFLAKVEAIPANRPGLFLAVGEQLKGKLPFTRLPINLTGDSQAQKSKDPILLRKRLAPKLAVIGFANHRLLARGDKRYELLVFSNGTWFHVIGRPGGKGAPVRWAFTHCEPYLRRTFAGSTAALERIIRDGLSGKKKPPEPNAREKPGLGPELLRKGQERTSIPARPRFLFAVIPTLGLGGPLAVLAMLFPGLFGGALLVLRSWIALLTVASVNSTLLVVYLWFGRAVEDTWLGDPLSLWFLMTLITLAGTLWAWRRHLKTLAANSTGAGPTRSEQVILWLASLALLAAFLFCWFGERAADDPAWKLLLVFCAGFWTGTGYLVYRRLGGGRRAALPTEGLILWTMVLASTLFAAAWPAPPPTLAGSFQQSSRQSVKKVWVFMPPQRGGMIVSSCLKEGGRVYVAAAHKQGAQFFGTLYCLDARTGKIVWAFDDDGDMKQVFSTPCIADGRLYVGEGFHENKACKLYCLEARTGKKLWDFATDSHTESSPCVAGGKVFFGAGDDGVYCLDAASGKKLWQYPGKEGDTAPTTGGGPGLKSGRRLKLHVDASPLVAAGRLYVGSGIDRDAEDPGDPALFCLDAATGKKRWLVALGRRDLPAWGSPALADGQVFFGVGNGDIFQDTKGEKPAGAVVCVEAATGKELWRHRVGGGVLKKPAVDRYHVYFGSRDGHCHCVERQRGRLRWKKDLGSAVVAAPALFRCPECGSARLYVMGSGGRLESLDPATGYRYWTFDLGRDSHLSSSPSVTATHTGQGERRRLYFGAGLNGATVPAVFCLEE
jgi:outer membrane protein assembly factor BamB